MTRTEVGHTDGGGRERQGLGVCSTVTVVALVGGQPGAGTVALSKCPLALWGWRQPEGSSSCAAGSRELGQTHLVEEVFGQKDKWTEFHVWQTWYTMTSFGNV